MSGGLSTIRDLPCFGRPARLVWRKRRWRCGDADCDAKTWTESSPHVSARVLLTDRAGAEACRQVGENARPVSELAEEFGVCWWTVMGAVIEHGTPLVDDPARVGPTEKLGVDETSWLKANRAHRTLYATGMVDLDAGIFIDMVKGNASTDLRGWLEGRDPAWLAGITTVTTDLAESYGPGCPRIWLMPPEWPTRSMSSESGTAAWTRCGVGSSNETLHHRGRKEDPLYRIRKLLLTGAERLDEQATTACSSVSVLGDPNRRSARRLAGQRIGPRHLPHRRPRRRRAAARQGHRRLPQTTSPRSSLSAGPWPVANRDPGPPSQQYVALLLA